MNIGMLWFDNDPKLALEEKVKRASDYYRAKYGRAPEVCMVNPASLSAEELKVGPIVIKPARTVLPGHLWLGMEERLLPTSV